MNHTSNPFPTYPGPLITQDHPLELAIDHMVPSELEQALLLTNLFEEPPNLLHLGFDHYDNKSDPNNHPQNHFLSQQDPSLPSPWWTIPSIENQPQSSANTTSSSLFAIDLKSDSNHGQQDPKMESNEPVKTLSGPDILDPTLNDHLPLQSTAGSAASNLIESWIDFTGGGSGSTSEVSPIQTIDPSPTEVTEPSIAIPCVTIDVYQANHLSSTPQQPTPAAENRPDKLKSKKTSKRRISSVSTISSSSVTSTSSASSSTSTSSSSSSSAFSPSSIAGGTRDQTDTNPRKTKTNKRNEFLERNRLAASRSRAKKKSYQRHLEEESQRLESEQIKLHQIIQDLIVEKENLKILVNQKFDFMHPNPLQPNNSDVSNSLPNDSSSSSF